MVWPGSSGHHQGEIPWILSLFYGNLPHGSGHIDVDDLVHSHRGLVEV